MSPTGIAAEKMRSVAATKMSVLDNSRDTEFALVVQSFAISSILFINPSNPFASKQFSRGAVTAKEQNKAAA